MIQLRSLVPEQMENPNLPGLEQETRAFAQRLIQKGLISSQRAPETSATEKPMDYVEDLADVIQNAVRHWIDVENSRGGC
jgi:hypothetical protein